MREDSLQLDQSIDSSMKEEFLKSDTCSQYGNFNISVSDQPFETPPKHKTGTVAADSKKALNVLLHKSQPMFCSIEETIERLLIYEKRKQGKLEMRVMLSKEKEKKMLKEKPDICIESKQLCEGKPPIYSQERINQIEQMKKEKLEKLRKNITEKRVEAEKKALEYNKPNKLGNTQLCFNPNTVTSIAFKTTDIIKSYKKTSEEEELQRCSFRPKTNKKSLELVAKNNKKPVVQRLLDYERSRKYAMKVKIKESQPSFKPTINIKIKSIVK